MKNGTPGARQRDAPADGVSRVDARFRGRRHVRNPRADREHLRAPVADPAGANRARGAPAPADRRRELAARLLAHARSVLHRPVPAGRRGLRRRPKTRSAQTLGEQQLGGVRELLGTYARLQDEWRADVAAPLLRHPNERARRARQAQQTLLGLRNAHRRLDSPDAGRHRRRARAQHADAARSLRVRARPLGAPLRRCSQSCSTPTARGSTGELEEERTTTEILQRAFRSESVPLPGLRGRQRVSVRDEPPGRGRRRVRRLPTFQRSRARAHRRRQRQGRRRRGADRVHQVHDSRDRAAPRAIPPRSCAEFNVAFAKAVGNPYLFVSMFVGVLDTTTFRSRLRKRRSRFGLRALGGRRASNSRSPGPCSACHGGAVRHQRRSTSHPATRSCWQPTA